MSQATLQFEGDSEERSDGEVIEDIRALISMHKAGKLGGATMPEDVHPLVDSGGADLCHYFTLCMALNYQRDSYALWRAATKTYSDPETRCVFSPSSVAGMSRGDLSALLTRHSVALQPNKHTDTWFRLCDTFVSYYSGDARNLLKAGEFDIAKILRIATVDQKKSFPYLSGPKISNYWLYVLLQYTSHPLVNRAALSVAPDTHVIQATQQLGLRLDRSGAAQGEQHRVAAAWARVLSGSNLEPIDVHTPLWLWSRGGFALIDAG